MPIIFPLMRGHRIVRKSGVGFPGGVPPFLVRERYSVQMRMRIFGITRDSAGAVLPACTVQLFQTHDDWFLGELVSDAAGYYEFMGSPAVQYYIVAYKAGSPDVAGTTVNTLTGA